MIYHYKSLRSDVHDVVSPESNPVPYSLFLIPYSLFLIPYSLFLIPCSLVPGPWSLVLGPGSLTLIMLSIRLGRSHSSCSVCRYDCDYHVFLRPASAD